MKESESDPTLKGLDPFIRRCMKDWNVPGLAVGILKNNRVIQLKSYGLRDIKRALPVNPDTHFGVGSCTKSFTATAIGILVDEGKLEWDTPVRKYLPTFKMKDPTATNCMTPRDLLTHRSGLPGHNLAWAASAATRETIVKRLRYLDLNKGFRTTYQYNNLMYLVLGALIEHVTGYTWETFIRDRIFKPLGMKNSYFFIRDLDESEHLSIGYDKDRNKLVRWDRGSETGINAKTGIGSGGPAGSIVSNLEDMCRWLKFQMNRGKSGRHTIISEQTLKEIHSPQVVDPELETDKYLLDGFYALGWRIQPYRGYKWIRHGGQFGGFNTDASFMPTESIGVIVLTNINDSPLTKIIPLNIYDRMLGQNEISWNSRCKNNFNKEQVLSGDTKSRGKKKHVAGRSLPFKFFVGDYLNRGYGRLSVSLEKRKLILRFNRFTFHLKHFQGNVFYLSHPMIGENIKVSFNMNNTGIIESVAIPFEPEVSDITFKKLKNKTAN